MVNKSDLDICWILACSRYFYYGFDSDYFSSFLPHGCSCFLRGFSWFFKVTSTSVGFWPALLSANWSSCPGKTKRDKCQVEGHHKDQIQIVLARNCQLLIIVVLCISFCYVFQLCTSNHWEGSLHLSGSFHFCSSQSQQRLLCKLPPEGRQAKKKIRAKMFSWNHIFLIQCFRLLKKNKSKTKGSWYVLNLKIIFLTRSS